MNIIANIRQAAATEIVSASNHRSYLAYYKQARANAFLCFISRHKNESYNRNACRSWVKVARDNKEAAQWLAVKLGIEFS